VAKQALPVLNDGSVHAGHASGVETTACPSFGPGSTAMLLDTPGTASAYSRGPWTRRLPRM